MVRRLGIPLAGFLLVVVGIAVSAAPASADPRDFTLINGTGTTIYSVYVAPTGPDDDWGDDILGQDVLPAGESVFIYFQRFTADNCYYDIKVVLDDGREGELLQVDLCTTTTVTFR